MYTFECTPIEAPTTYLCFDNLYLGTYICVDQLMYALDSPQVSSLDVFHTVYSTRRDR